MNISKEQLEAMAQLPDDVLWAEIVRIARQYGFTLPDATPPHSDLQRLRGAVSGAKLNTADALRVLSNYKRRSGR